MSAAQRPDPNRVIGGRERGPAEGTLIFAITVGLASLALLIVRVITGELEPFGTASNVMLAAASCVLGWPALQRVRRNRARERERLAATD